MGNTQLIFGTPTVRVLPSLARQTHKQEVNDMGLEGLEKIADHTARLDSLMEEFDGTVRSMAIRADEKSGADVLFMKVEMDDGKIVTQKLKGIHVTKLLEILGDLEINAMSSIVDHKFHFKKTVFPIGFPRWLPVKKVKG